MANGVDLTVEQVRTLLRQQHPDLADRRLVFGSAGWDNQLWRLGDDLVVRLPWQTEIADALLVKEYTWLPALAPELSLPVPVPLRLGRPSAQYPHPWTVAAWVSGSPADLAPVTDDGTAADQLAEFLTSLNRPAPVDAPGGRVRGGALAHVASHVERQLDLLEPLCLAACPASQALPDPQHVRSIWNDAVAAPEWSEPRVWVHADLHPANVLTRDGSLAGVVDFGDLCAGDRAIDLASGWIVLPNLDAVERFRSSCRPTVDDATWRRSKGWAIWRALGCLAIAAADGPGAKPTWGRPALASLHLLSRAKR